MTLHPKEYADYDLTDWYARLLEEASVVGLPTGFGRISVGNVPKNSGGMEAKQRLADSEFLPAAAGLSGQGMQGIKGFQKFMRLLCINPWHPWVIPYD